MTATILLSMACISGQAFEAIKALPSPRFLSLLYPCEWARSVDSGKSIKGMKTLLSLPLPEVREGLAKFVDTMNQQSEPAIKLPRSGVHHGTPYTGIVRHMTIAEMLVWDVDKLDTLYRLVFTSTPKTQARNLSAQEKEFVNEFVQSLDPFKNGFLYPDLSQSYLYRYGGVDSSPLQKFNLLARLFQRRKPTGIDFGGSRDLRKIALITPP